MNVGPIGEKFRAFGWNVLEIDGHDMEGIVAALESAGQTKGRPTVLVARTVKGKGVPRFEHKASYHGVAPNDDELNEALLCLGCIED